MPHLLQEAVFIVDKGEVSHPVDPDVYICDEETADEHLHDITR